MKVLVCGARDWKERGPIEREMRKLPPGTIIIHGKAPGADTIAGQVAMALGFPVRDYPADWDKHGKAAGPIRNSKMLQKEHRLDEPIDQGLAFHKDIEHSKGTWDMVKKLRAKFIPTEVFAV